MVVQSGDPAKIYETRSKDLQNREWADYQTGMEKMSAPKPAADLADKIAKFQTSELERFLRDHLQRRDLHQVVANLNEAAVSKGNPKAEDARKALKRLGFVD